MKRLWILLQIFNVAATQDERNLDDPCFNFKHLHEMEKRYKTYESDVDNGEIEICDRYLIPNTGEWYYSEEDMLVEPPPLYRCGTAFPIYLLGGIPVPADGIVNRTACMSGSESVCDKQYNIKIKACAGYSVYFLVPSSGCPEAYCFGIGSSEAPPENATLKPEVKFHIEKIETRPEVWQDRLEFECFIGEQKDLPFPFYQISWLRDGVSFYTRTEPVTNIVGLRLTEDRSSPFHFDSLGVTLSCISRAKHTDKGRPGPMTRSADFFTGVVLEKSTVELATGGATTVRFNITVPFGCGWRSENKWNPCSLDVQMYVPNVPNSNKCKGEITANEDAENCFRSIHITDWDKPHSLLVQYKERGTYSAGNGETFVLQLITTNGFHPVWNNYLLPLVYVTIYDNNSVWKGRTCSSQNDPHMTTFDGRQYENHNAGTYILYEHVDKLRPMQVQIQFRKCYSGATIYCNCGVAARAGGDVFVIDFCSNKRIMQYISCHDKILDVRRYNKNTHIYNIFFPTGTEVQVHTYGSNLNVLVKASRHDTQKTKGLCGFLSGTCTDDFQKRDSSYSSVNGAREECRGQRFTSLYPNDFSLSWKVNNAESLFEMSENQQIGLWEDPNKYCTCPDLQADPPFKFECAPASVTTCDRDQNYAEVGKGICQALSAAKKRANARIASVSYPWTSFKKMGKLRSDDKIESYSNVSMTFDEALVYCINTIGNTSAFSACSEVPNVPTEEALEICAFDITLTNSLDWVAETLETLKAACITELQKNDSLHGAGNNGTELSIADQIESIICPGLPECSGKGECVNGTCKCQQGYIEIDCSKDLSQPPELYGIRGEGFCDINEIACDTSFLVGNAISYSPTMACKVQDFLILRNGERHNVTEYIVDGVLETIVEVHCPVHRTNSSSISNRLWTDQIFVEGHSISVGYDNINFGDTYTMFVFDSICQEPDTASYPPTFVLLANTCFINGRCLLDGDRNVSNSCFKCDSSNPYTWSIDSLVSGCALDNVKMTEQTNVMYIAGPIIGAVAGILVIISTAIIIRKCKLLNKKAAVNDSQANASGNQTYSLSSTTLQFTASSGSEN